jgi:uncharacterized protein YgbK (DUF1537 family)
VPELAVAGGFAAVLSGSCSQATLRQVEVMKGSHPSCFLDPSALVANPQEETNRVITWALPLLGHGPVLIYASASPEQVRDVQSRFGREVSGAIVEDAMARIADALVSAGVRRIVVAGGETSGAVVKALGITALEIGPQIEPGVPATLSIGSSRIGLALKSGNFGKDDFFTKALGYLR